MVGHSIVESRAAWNATMAETEANGRSTRYESNLKSSTEERYKWLNYVPRWFRDMALRGTWALKKYWKVNYYVGGVGHLHLPVISYDIHLHSFQRFSPWHLIGFGDLPLWWFWIDIRPVYLSSLLESDVLNRIPKRREVNKSAILSKIIITEIGFSIASWNDG